MAVSTVTSNDLGTILKVVSKNGIINNLSEDSAAWDLIKKVYVAGDAKGRQINYNIRTALGISACAFIAPVAGDFPSGSKSTLSEGTAQWKDFAATIEVENTLIQKAGADPTAYGKPLLEELEAKTIGMSRILSAAVYGDGTGVIAEAQDAGSVSGGNTVFNIETGDAARGFVGWVEEGDILLAVNSDGTDAHPTLDSGTFSHYVVDSVDRDAETITLSAKNTAGTDLTVTATGITDGDFLVRGKTADTIQDLSSGSSSVDYNTLSNAIVGLDSLTQDDNRLVNGINLTGNAAGSRQDESGQPIGPQAFQKMLSKLKRRAARGRYSYERALMADETIDSMVEANEADRRFQSVTDSARGFERLAYVHNAERVFFEADEFCPKKRVYILPKSGALEFHGTDVDFVMPNGGDKFRQKASSNGGYSTEVQAHMLGSGALLTNHAAAMGCIHNFT